MITRQPKPGDKIEFLKQENLWAFWGIVSHLEGSRVFVAEHGMSFIWRFGTVGNAAPFRIVEPVALTMDDPFFN